MSDVPQMLEEIRDRLNRLCSEPSFRPGYLKGDRQAAHYCGMKRDAFRKWVEKERVPYKTIAGHRYFKLTILDRRMTPPEARREEGYTR